MGRGLSYKLRGQCINAGSDSGLYFFKTVNLNMVWSSPTCSAQTQGGFFACGSSPFFPPPNERPGTEGYPINYVGNNGLVYGKSYGKSQFDPIELTTLTGNPVYFNATDFAPWRPVNYCPPPLNRESRSGPAFKNCHVYGAMTRRLANNNNYTGRAEYEFVDGFEVPYADYNIKLCGDGCPTKNWLIFSNPAQPLFSTVNQPFTILTHFEQSGEPAPSDPANGGNLYVPFCGNMNVRAEDGTVIGYYSGLSISAVFGMCSLAYGFADPYRPPDEWSPLPPPKPKADPARAWYSLEVSVYFRGVTTNPDPIGTLGSPLIGKFRYYLYSGLSTGNWRYPFRVLFQDTIYATNPMRVNCNIIGEAPQEIIINTTNQKALVSY